MKKSVAIIGGGPAGIMLAAQLDEKQFKVSIYEKNKSTGRKFLVAGAGGFNLTHSENVEKLVNRYQPKAFLEAALRSFTNVDLIQWLEGIGVPCYIGTSNRVFPEKGIKPIAVLQALLDELERKEVKLYGKKEWQGWTDTGALIFAEPETVVSDYVVFALGGGSWKVTGSDGCWAELFKKKGIAIKKFKAANCAYQVNWNSEFLKHHEGKPLKNINVISGNKKSIGEAIITKFGIEGNAIYALTDPIQSQLDEKGSAKIFIDLKPMLSLETIQRRLERSQKLKTTSTLSKNINFGRTEIALIKSIVTKEAFQNNEKLAKSIKQLPLQLLQAAAIDEAISTTGGIDREEVNSNFELKKLPKHYCIGEMLDWNAPTGGYLLQGCFSSATYLAKHLNKSKKIS